MVLNLRFEIPDDSDRKFIAEYIRQQSDSAAGQIEYAIIDVPAVDEEVAIDIGEWAHTDFFRSE